MLCGAGNQKRFEVKGWRWQVCAYIPALGQLRVEFHHEIVMGVDNEDIIQPIVITSSGTLHSAVLP
jgi:hypothetical protein